MSGSDSGANRSAEALRRSFDLGFAGAPVAHGRSEVDLLSIRAGSDPYVLRLAEVAGLHVGRTVVPVPSSVPELLGVASIRGGLVPVYRLTSLLRGEPRPEAPRWFVVSGGSDVVALAFDGFEGYRRVAAAAIHGLGPADSHAASAMAEGVSEAVQIEDEVRGVVSIPFVVAMIRKRCAMANAAKER